MKQKTANLLKKAVLMAKKSQEWSDFELPEIQAEYTKNDKFGDYSSNIAMVLAKKVGKDPMEIAEAIKDAICHSERSEESRNIKSNDTITESFANAQDDTVKNFEKIEVAAPGYLNFYLSKKYLQDVVKKINAEKENFGASQKGKGIKINNEFISANPTGPLHLGNGRGGFYGDSLSKILRKAGFEVTVEYYVNDAGEQVVKLGHSVLKDDEKVYEGEYIDELNKKFGKIQDVREVGEKSANYILENIIKKTVKEKMRIEFDEWTSEKELQKKGYDNRAVEMLKKKGFTYESDGALWLKTTEFGDDKDRVLVKSDGKNAYIAGDCGYMLDKIERGFDKLIMGLGADHHGYVSRLKAVAKMLGFHGDFRIILSQLVRLVKDGKEVRMSKRAGNVVYIDDLIEEVGHDVARFFFLMYSPDTHMNFDLGLAKEQSQKNPVFYVQYAHARICSILQKSLSANNKQESASNDINLSLLSHEKELDLIKELNKFPELIEEISESYEAHRLPHYALKLADKFHSFYDACRVIDEENPELSKARLSLVNSARIVLAETLRLIGVSAPKSM
ncbi:MAG TPA: arginine--tRNA ligase [Candidatus Moranbacteria bacterium]|nr:arginine--tRNA ligase [Candidatus Moranbacteria bacterium]HQB59626.1 arginine--tRNA ligase [Candidatus Moranbacteria bacterium]